MGPDIRDTWSAKLKGIFCRAFLCANGGAQPQNHSSPLLVDGSRGVDNTEAIKSSSQAGQRAANTSSGLQESSLRRLPSDRPSLGYAAADTSVPTVMLPATSSTHQEHVDGSRNVVLLDGLTPRSSSVVEAAANSGSQQSPFHKPAVPRRVPNQTDPGVKLEASISVAAVGAEIRRARGLTTSGIADLAGTSSSGPFPLMQENSQLCANFSNLLATLPQLCQTFDSVPLGIAVLVLMPGPKLSGNTSRSTMLPAELSSEFPTIAAADALMKQRYGSRYHTLREGRTSLAEPIALGALASQFAQSRHQSHRSRNSRQQTSNWVCETSHGGSVGLTQELLKCVAQTAGRTSRTSPGSPLDAMTAGTARQDCSLQAVYINAALKRKLNVANLEEFEGELELMVEADPSAWVALQEVMLQDEASPVSHIFPRQDPVTGRLHFVSLKIDPMGYLPGAGQDPLPAMLLSFGRARAYHLPTANMLVRERQLLSKVPCMLTLLSFDGKPLHQNAPSVTYFGTLVDPNKDLTSQGNEVPDPQELLDGFVKADSGPWSTKADLTLDHPAHWLNVLFKYEPEKLDEMLQAVKAGNKWKAVVRVPAQRFGTQQLPAMKSPSAVAGVSPSPSSTLKFPTPSAFMRELLSSKSKENSGANSTSSSIHMSDAPPGKPHIQTLDGPVSPAARPPSPSPLPASAVGTGKAKMVAGQEGSVGPPGEGKGGSGCEVLVLRPQEEPASGWRHGSGSVVLQEYEEWDQPPLTKRDGAELACGSGNASQGPSHQEMQNQFLGTSHARPQPPSSLKGKLRQSLDPAAIHQVFSRLSSRPGIPDLARVNRTSSRPDQQATPLAPEASTSSTSVRMLRSKSFQQQSTSDYVLHGSKLHGKMTKSLLMSTTQSIDEVAAAAVQELCAYHELEASPFNDPTTMSSTVMLLATDVTASVRLKQQLYAMRQQQCSWLRRLYPRHVLDGVMLPEARCLTNDTAGRSSLLPTIGESQAVAAAPSSSATSHQAVTIMFAWWWTLTPSWTAQRPRTWCRSWHACLGCLTRWWRSTRCTMWSQRVTAMWWRAR